MKTCTYQSVLCLAIGLFTLSARAQQVPYSHGNPSNGEQYMLELINRARAYPAAEGVTLAREPDPLIQEFYKIRSVDLSQLQQQFASYAAKPPLAFNAGLITAATNHSQWMIDNNTESHFEIPGTEGFTGATPLARIENFFPNPQQYGENAATSIPDLNFADAGFLVDWAVPDLGHRAVLMGLYEGTQVGSYLIGIGLVATPNHIYGASQAVVTEDLVYSNQVFLTGVVYQDPDHLGLYSQGQGLAGVTIRPSVGNYYAVTSSSGGYAIPIDTSVIPSTGSFTLTASGPGIGAKIQKSIYMNGNSNVKVDFVPDEIPTPIMLSTVIQKSASLGGSTWAQISVTRTANLQSVLNLKYGLSGDAVNGVDYKLLTKTLQFPAGVSTMTIKIKSLITNQNVKKNHRAPN